MYRLSKLGELEVLDDKGAVEAAITECYNYIYKRPE